MKVRARKVKSIHFGKEHMIVHTNHCEKHKKDCVYGMGSNMYGQLGRDPISSKSDTFEQLIPVDPILLTHTKHSVL